MSTALLEVCVDDVAGLHAALDGGADRIELCSSLAVGGLTPSYGFMSYAASVSSVPVYGMIRPRAGDFCFHSDEVAMMIADVKAARAAGLAGVVIGAASVEGFLDESCLKTLMDVTEGLGVTLHRVFDTVVNPKEALELAIDLGIERILTSGGASSIDGGLDQLEATRAMANDRIVIMPGSGVTEGNVSTLLSLGFSELHASCSSTQQSACSSGSLQQLGFVAAEEKRTDRDKVAAMKVALAK